MKTGNYLRAIVISVAVVSFSIVGAAQDKVAEVSDATRPAANKPADIRTASLRQLGLSPDQVQRIRRINVERKPLMDAAQARLRETNRSLDDMIYADNANDVEIQARLKDFQLAQAEVSKIRFMNELAVRRILTPEQLVRFRRLRQRFEQMRDNVENRQTRDTNVKPRGELPTQNLVKANKKNPSF